MKTLIDTNYSAKELNNQIELHLTQLAKATDEARRSEEILRYLDFCAKFHNYSPGNIWLILLTKPNASYVAGFHRWKSLGRWVRKGEHGIPILAPMQIKEENDDGIEVMRLVGFKVVYVFDVSQTEGQPLPPMPNWKSPQKNKELNQRLIQFAEGKGISVSFENFSKDIQGVSKGKAIAVDNSAGTKTLIHEIAHELMHQEGDRLQSRATKELEAEAVAYVVSNHFGLEELNSPNYLAFFEVTTEKMLAHMDRIRNTVNEIITAISPDS